MLAAWLLVPFAGLFAWPEPSSAMLVAAWLGLIALVGLCIRLLLLGFSGYERMVGLRIISREVAGARSRRRVLGCIVLALAGLLGLWAFQAGWLGAAEGGGPDSSYDGLRLVLVGVVAVSTFAALFLALARWFSVLGTTSIFGVVLGVAALVVVQSVATGFQHEFERRVLGVYAHINVTQSFGISEYRRFEAWLRTVPGVTGASPFAYYAMVLAPSQDPSEVANAVADPIGDDSASASPPMAADAKAVEGAEHGDVRLATVLVKGIDPTTAAEVIDVVPHLERGSDVPVSLDELRSDHVLIPMPDRAAEELPPVIAAQPDPRGDGWYAPTLAAAKKARGETLLPAGIGDAWDDPPSLDSADGTDATPSERAADVDAAGVDGELPTMFVGKILAQKLSLEIDDQVLLVDPGSSFDHSEEPKFMHYRVAGIFKAGFQEYDEGLVYVDIKEIQRFKYSDKDKVSGVDLRLADPSAAASVGAHIRRELGDEYSVLEWQKLNENLFSSIRTQKNVITIILSLVICVASFNVLSTLWTMVVRRTPEIAILMSMGATGPQVARVFQVTGMTIGLAGAMAGIALGLMMCWLVELYGYTLDAEVYFIEHLPVEISLVQLAWVFGMTLLICYVATIPPSLRASRLRPVEGLRYE